MRVRVLIPADGSGESLLCPRISGGGSGGAEEEEDHVSCDRGENFEPRSCRTAPIVSLLEDLPVL